jgi:hypothetical protein
LCLLQKYKKRLLIAKGKKFACPLFLPGTFGVRNSIINFFCEKTYYK